MRIISGTARGTKLYTLEGLNTRPTLDRVKESIFNIIHKYIQEATVLDLFSGSGAIGLEFASRGAKKVYLCDKSKEEINIIKKNIEKTHLEEKTIIYNLDFKLAIEEIKEKKFNIIYLDPPYKTNFIEQSIELLRKTKAIDSSTIIIAETDNEKQIEKQIEKLEVKIIDKRKYGRACILFLKKLSGKED